MALLCSPLPGPSPLTNELSCLMETCQALCSLWDLSCVIPVPQFTLLKWEKGIASLVLGSPSIPHRGNQGSFLPAFVLLGEG